MSSMMSQKCFDPNLDGINHINVYSRGKTEIGRFLSNMAHTPFEYQRFESQRFDLKNVESFWYYAKLEWTCDPRLENIFEKNAFEAKKLGKLIEKDHEREFEHIVWDEQEFRRSILDCIRVKIESYPEMKDSILENDLPLNHYYVNQSGGVVRLPKYNWLITGIENLISDMNGFSLF